MPTTNIQNLFHFKSCPTKLKAGLVKTISMINDAKVHKKRENEFIVKFFLNWGFKFKNPFENIKWKLVK